MTGLLAAIATVPALIDAATLPCTPRPKCSRAWMGGVHGLERIGTDVAIGAA